MRTLPLLKTKLQATTLFSGGSLRQLRERDQLWVLPIAAIGIVAGAGVMIWMLYGNYRAMALVGASLGTPELPLFLGTLLSWVLLFVVGFPLALSVLYFSRDTTMLAALPIRSGRIIGANVGLLYLYLLPVCLLVFVPSVAAYAAVSGLSVALIVTAAVSGVLLPLVPLGIAIVFVTILTRLVNLSRFRTVLEAAGMVLLLVSLVGLQVLFSRSLLASGASGALESSGVTAAEGVGAALQGVGAGVVAMLTNLQRAVAPANWVARAMTPGGAAWLFATGGISLGVIVGSTLVVQAGYLRTIAAGSVTPTRRRVPGSAVVPARHGLLRALVGRELRVLFSNSTFLFESVGELLVFPLLLVIFRIAVPGSLMDQILPLISGTRYLVPVALAALILFAGINTVSATAISREGSTFDLSLSIPVSGRSQVRAKIATYLLLFSPAMMLNAAIVVSLLRLPWWNVFVLGAAGLPFLLLIGSATLFADIRRPLLTWTHPQQAVKQNMNVLVGMGLALLCLAATAAAGVLSAVSGHPPALVLGIATGLATAGGLVIYQAVCRYADRRYGVAFSVAPGT